jgi:hypothetical protein
MPGATKSVAKLQLAGGEWAVYALRGPNNNGPWEFVGVEEFEGADTAARVSVAKRWTAGTHAVLVVGHESAHEFKVTVGTEEVGS